MVLSVAFRVSLGYSKTVFQTGGATVPVRMALPADELSSMNAKHVFAVWLYAFLFCEFHIEASGDKVFITFTTLVFVI